MALLSAVTTALTHALLKLGKNKLAIRTWISLLCFVIAFPIALFVGLPPRDLFPWLIASCLLHALYQFALIWSYDVSDFSTAFPIARGVSPVFATALGIAFLGDNLSVLTLAGIAVVCLGIISIAAFGGASRNGLLAAVTTGLLTSLYTIVDAHSVRIAPTALTFIAWSYVLEVIAMPALFLFRHGHEASKVLMPDFPIGVVAAIGTLISFGAALFAFRYAPVGVVSALRELSVLVGLVLAVIILKERFNVRRVSGSIAIVAGATCVIAGIRPV